MNEPRTELWREEFEDFGELPFNPEDYGLTDTSWHNDVAPSFSVVAKHGDMTVHVETLWLDYADPAQREMEGNKRFMYLTYDPKGEHNEPLETLLDTDDVDEAKRFLEARFAQRQKAGGR